MSNRVRNKSIDGIGNEGIPEHGEIDADADGCKQDSCADPLDHVEDGKEDKGDVKNFASFFRVGELSSNIAWYQSIIVRVQINNSYGSNKLD